MSEEPRVDALRQLVERSPEDPAPRYGLAQELRKEGEPGEALEHYRRVIELDPGFTAAYVGAGELLADLERWEEARRILKRGMDEAARKGAARPRSHMRRILESLEGAERDVPSATTPLSERTPPERPVSLDDAADEG